MQEPAKTDMSEISLRRRLPTLLAEVVSVFFAVIVALAVDEYWEEREHLQLAEHTVDAIARFMELDDVIQLAQVYELQRFYTRTQDEFASLIAEVAARIETAPVPTLLELQSRLASAQARRAVLSTVFACTLARLPGQEAVTPGDCPNTA